MVISGPRKQKATFGMRVTGLVTPSDWSSYTACGPAPKSLSWLQFGPNIPPCLQLHRGIFFFILGQGLILLPQYHQLDGIDAVFYKGNKLSYYAWTKSKY